MTRTGLIEWPAHQLGGSTFSTSGAACAATLIAIEQAERKISRDNDFGLFIFELKRCAEVYFYDGTESPRQTGRHTLCNH